MRKVRELGLFRLAIQGKKREYNCPLKKYQGREELFKLKDGAGTRTNDRNRHIYE